MDCAYNSDLHKFVDIYFKAVGAKIVLVENDFFTVEYPNGKKEIFTYLPRLAAENNEMKLLAKGSKHLRLMMEECNSRAAFSKVRMDYNDESIGKALSPKSCCDLCPFFTICEKIDLCCDFCYNYRFCNTCLENTTFLKLGDLKSSELLDLICFVFSVELSNDYSLSQKTEKTITILINMKNGNIVRNVLAKNFTSLDIKPLEKAFSISSDDFSKYLNIARKEADEATREQLDVFKKSIETPLMDKISSIINKYEEDYIDNYTKISLGELEQLQDDGLRLCEREIRGYTLNSSFKLKNVIIMQASKDNRDIIVKHSSNDHSHSQKEFSLDAEIFTGIVNIWCSQCGKEIDKGILCDNGHVLCKNCGENCCICHRAVCDTCGDETANCTTCGDTVCTDCVVTCSSCGAGICSDHAYICRECGKSFCIDCYNICHICGDSICSEHSTICSCCAEPVCHEHTNSCSICSKVFCDTDINECTVCGIKLCEAHSHISAYSKKALCGSHISYCDVCHDIFSSVETVKCTKCNDKMCPNHIKNCSKCQKPYCSMHINHCKSCGEDVCDCTSFISCKLCGEEYCSDCLNSKGYCKACSELKYINRNDKVVLKVLEILPSLEKYKNFYSGNSNEIRILFASGLFHSCVIVMNNNGEVTNNKELTVFDSFMNKRNIKLNKR